MVFCYDLIAIGVAFTLSFLLRFDFQIPAAEMKLMWTSLPFIYLVQSGVFVLQGLYRGIWSFASLRDLMLIIRAVALAVLFSVAMIAGFSHFAGWPRSVFMVDSVLLVLMVGGGRFAYRIGREFALSFGADQKRILIVGAGHSGHFIAREFSSRPELRAQILGYLDDSPKLAGLRVNGVPVLGLVETLPIWLDDLRPDEVIIAIPSLPGSRVKQILGACLDRKIPCRICPPIRDVLLGHIELSQLREVRVEDVLRREVVQVDDSGLRAFISNRRVLVTGAGGSIGSELCRQILKFAPESLVLYERSEYNLYRFEKELKLENKDLTKTQLSFVIGDVLDQRKLTDTFSRYQPEIVLHAAAYKHVPLMEDNVFESLQNNVVGTYRVVEAAARAGVKTFVLISTDKAVRPTSVMGATKRMAELVTHVVGSEGNIQTLAVRFGNVLDSEGSVLPLFREQIARGGPVTVTHPDVTRYFMTIPEASQLVLQAALLGKGSEVFLLDMGEPVLIRELAEEMIKLSGLRPGEDIEIRYTGLRKGEKLYEELLTDLSHAERTLHPKIVVSTREHKGVLQESWRAQLKWFIESKTVPRTAELLAWVKAWVPEYASPNLPDDAAVTGEWKSTQLH
jgi:FlaA1/EpsC-like NDP-sugar epimerase